MHIYIHILTYIYIYITVSYIFISDVNLLLFYQLCIIRVSRVRVITSRSHSHILSKSMSRLCRDSRWLKSQNYVDFAQQIYNHKSIINPDIQISTQTLQATGSTTTPVLTYLRHSISNFNLITPESTPFLNQHNETRLVRKIYT